MSSTFTQSQRAYIRRKSRLKPITPDEEGGELNVIPFLDMIINVMMFVLATITTVFTAMITIPAPRATSGPSHGPEDPDEITLTVKVVRDGYIVGAPGGFLQPNCTDVAQATLTVALIAGNHDGPGLTRCLVNARNNPPWRTQLQTRRNIQVAVNGDVPYHVLITTLDAIRETRPGAGDMFTEPALGILQ